MQIFSFQNNRHNNKTPTIYRSKNSTRTQYNTRILLRNNIYLLSFDLASCTNLQHNFVCMHRMCVHCTAHAKYKSRQNSTEFKWLHKTNRMQKSKVQMIYVWKWENIVG